MSVVKLVCLGPPAARVCATAEAELFADGDLWSELASTAELTAPNSFYIGLIAGADKDEELYDYAGVTKLRFARATGYEIHTTDVGQEWQYREFGAQLMDMLMAVMAEDPGPAFLEVRTNNEPAIAMHRRYGFEGVGLRKDYYPDSGAGTHIVCRPAPAGQMLTQ